MTSIYWEIPNVFEQGLLTYLRGKRLIMALETICGGWPVCGEDLFCQILQHKENQYSTYYENSHCNIEKYRRYFSRFGYKFHSDLSEDRRNRKWVMEFWMIDIDRTECYLNTDSSHRSISCLQKWKTQYYTKFLKFTQYYLKLVKFTQYYLKLVNSGGTHHPYPPP